MVLAFYLLLKPAILQLEASHFLNVGGQPAVQLAQHLLLLSPAGIQKSLDCSEKTVNSAPDLGWREGGGRSRSSR